MGSPFPGRSDEDVSEGEFLDDAAVAWAEERVRGASEPHSKLPPEKSIEEIRERLAAAGDQWDFTSALSLLEGRFIEIGEPELANLRLRLKNGAVILRGGDWGQLVPPPRSGLATLMEAWLQLVESPEKEPEEREFTADSSGYEQWVREHGLWRRQREFVGWRKHVLSLVSGKDAAAVARKKRVLEENLNSLQWGVPAGLTIARFVALMRAYSRAGSERNDAGPYSLLSMLFGFRAIEASCSAFAQHRGVVRDAFRLESLRVKDADQVHTIVAEWKSLGGKVDSKSLSFSEILRTAIRCQYQSATVRMNSVLGIFQRVCARLPPVPKPIEEGCTFDESFGGLLKQLKISGKAASQLKEIDKTLMAVCHLRNSSIFTHGLQNPRGDTCRFVLAVAEVVASEVFDGAWREDEPFLKPREPPAEMPTFEGTVDWMSQVLTSARNQLMVLSAPRPVPDVSTSCEALAP